MSGAVREEGDLELRREAKVADLLVDARHGRFEASGVVVVDGGFYVIFDNTPSIGRLDPGLAPGDGRHGLIVQPASEETGYEDIAHDRHGGRFFVLIESMRHADGYMARVREYDEAFAHVASAWLPFGLAGPNKGLEGLTCVHRAGRTYLLGLCEGNLCLDGEAGRRPGGGRIQVFGRVERGWEHVGTIALPPSLGFDDYSSVALAGERLCVVSQESSALWVGTLARSAWQVAGEGAVHRFPRDADGKVVYCNVEGVSWLSANEVVVVSDKSKPGSQKPRCRAKDQSVHVFALP